MATARLTPDDPSVGLDEVVVEPASTAWHRRLTAELPPDATTDQAAGQVADLVATELRTDHVALWGREGEEYVVLGATGLSAGARRMRLATDYPVVNVCRGMGGRILRDPDTHHGPRAPGLPGSSSTAYAMLLLDGAGQVEMVTMSGRRLLAEEVDAVRDLVVGLFGERPEDH